MKDVSGDKSEYTGKYVSRPSENESKEVVTNKAVETFVVHEQFPTQQDFMMILQTDEDADCRLNNDSMNGEREHKMFLDNNHKSQSPVD